LEAAVTTPTDRRLEALRAEVNRLTWVHRIDLGHGLITPGLWGDPQPVVMAALDRIDFRGKKVLDIGCWDGLWSFEAEKRGAAVVYATDLVSQRDFRGHPTVHLARKALRSRVIYRPDVSVYDVERLGVRDFDVVIYAGVYYHVKDPLRSFSALRRVLKVGGHLITEGAILDEPGVSARFFYHDHHKGDRSNWWVPTRDCLRQWVECSYFSEVENFPVWDAGGGNLRATILSTAVCRADPEYSRPDEELRPFDLNDYRTEVPEPSPRGPHFRLLDSLRRAKLRG
jgi:tRNA (mo5U34)-methyltransferase